MSFLETTWTKILSWLTSAKAAVIAEGQTIITELEPVVEADILADGGTALATVAASLVAGTDPLAAIASAATTVWQAAEAQGINISKAASTTAGAFLVAKAQSAIMAAAAIGTVPAMTPAAS